MNRKLQILLISIVALCLIADVWVVTKFIIHRPARAVVLDSKPGEATVRFEKMPLGAVDAVVVTVIVIANVGAILFTRKAWMRVRRDGT
jgi:hypothetical protein